MLYMFTKPLCSVYLAVSILGKVFDKISKNGDHNGVRQDDFMKAKVTGTG